MVQLNQETTQGMSVNSSSPPHPKTNAFWGPESTMTHILAKKWVKLSENSQTGKAHVRPPFRVDTHRSLSSSRVTHECRCTYSPHTNASIEMSEQWSIFLRPLVSAHRGMTSLSPISKHDGQCYVPFSLCYICFYTQLAMPLNTRRAVIRTCSPYPPPT